MTSNEAERFQILVSLFFKKGCHPGQVFVLTIDYGRDKQKEIRCNI